MKKSILMFVWTLRLVSARTFCSACSSLAFTALALWLFSQVPAQAKVPPELAGPVDVPMTTFMVTNTNDSGAGSLRQAITDANADGLSDTINFDIPSGDPGCSPTTQVCTITLNSALPFLNTPMTIDGYTQPGAQPNTNATGGLNTVLKVELRTSTNFSAFVVIFVSDVTIRGLVINHCSPAINVDIGVSDLRIEGNFLGTDPSGTQAAASDTAVQISTQLGGAQVFVGGANAAARNLISGNSFQGIKSGGNFNGSNTLAVQGNLIGTDISGQSALGNGFSGIQVGTFTPTSFVAQNNVISGNATDGIQIAGQGTAFSGTVQGNMIGVAADGVTPLGNGGRGILYEDRLPYTLTIGGTNGGEGNIIAFNSDRGVMIDSGPGPEGPTAILGNSIFSNGRLGIDLIGGTEDVNGVTANDHCDGDDGPNNLQNFPVIASAIFGGGMVTVAGTLDSLPDASFRLEFFSSAVGDPSGFGEGQTFLGSVNRTTDASCTVPFGPITFPVPSGQTIITATATRLDGSLNPVETSEFSGSLAGRPTLYDFDGDGRADISVFRPSDTVWYMSLSKGGFTAREWGLAADPLVPADYDGDGKTDIASWREVSLDPGRSYFDIINSFDNSLRKEQFGSPGDKPIVAGDWDGDGRSDLAVYRDGGTGGQSFFFYRPSAQPGVDFIAIPWGTGGDKPMRGDFDGDGKLDAAVFRPSDNLWYILQSSDGTVRHESWGLACDTFVPGDYDGDRKTDLAVFRGDTWYIRRSSDGQPTYQNFGLNSDILVPADYDGDQRTDIAVYRNGDWYILQSQTGSVRYERFGLAADIPVESAYTFSPHCAN